MLPGINRLDYDGEYWPESTVSLQSKESSEWLQKVLWLVVLPSRPDGYDPLKIKNLTTGGVETLAKASAKAWDAICAQDKVSLGQVLSHHHSTLALNYSQPTCTIITMQSGGRG